MIICNGIILRGNKADRGSSRESLLRRFREENAYGYLQTNGGMGLKISQSWPIMIFRRVEWKTGWRKES